MKRNLSIILAVTLGWLLLAGGSLSDGHAAEPIVLRTSAAWPKTSPFTKLTFDFVDLVESTSKGRLKLKWIGGPEYIKVKDFSTACAAGTIDIVQTCLGYHSGKVPAAGIADAYPLYRSYNTEPEAYFKTREILNPELKKKLNFMTLACTQDFPFFLWTKEPVRNLGDLKGSKIRGHGAFVPFIVKALGASPVTISSTEVYTALERGIIDGAVRNIPALNSFMEYELTHYGISTPVTWATGDLCISVRTWNELPSDLQEVLVKAGKEITRKAAKHWQAQDQALMEKFPQQGVVFFDLPEETKEHFLNAIERGANEAAYKLSPEYAEQIIEVFKETSKVSQ